MKKRMISLGLLLVLGAPIPGLAAGEEVAEVRDETQTQAVVKKHTKTGRPYVTVKSDSAPAVLKGQSREENRGPVRRPDYRLLDWKRKDGEIPYEGPWSDRTKVYLFAAGVATVGVAGGGLVMASAPAAAGAAASATGAGSFGAAGGAVAGGSVAAAAIAVRPDPKQSDYDHTAESRELKP
jgi:hypothetical protein